MRKIYIILLVLLFSCSKESGGGGNDALLAQNAALNAQIAALNAQISSLNIEISLLNSQVAEGSSLQETLDSKTVELNIAVANYENALIDIVELEETVTSLTKQFGELLDTIEYWLSQAAGNYEFKLILDGVDAGDYVWEIGLTEDNEAIWNTYYWDGTCYRKNNASSLGEESSAYFSDSSYNDLGVIAYNVPASNVGITGYETVITWDTFIRTSDGGLLAMLDVYDNSWNLLRRIQNIDGPLYPSTNVTFCEESSSGISGESNGSTETDNSNETTETDNSNETAETDQSSGDGSDNTPVVESGNIYLDSNGVTIKATADAQVGDQEAINGNIYTVVDESQLREMVKNEENITYVVTSKITKMHELFLKIDDSAQLFDDRYYGSYNINGDISSWDVSNVTKMNRMFWKSQDINQDISSWDVSNVTNMVQMFDESDFNDDISSWDVSSVTNMFSMFEETEFNQDISSWNVSNVTIMSSMFYKNLYFDQDIGDWDVSNVTDMSSMFHRAFSFNQDISSWDVSSVTKMNYMFTDTAYFDSPLDNWDVSSVTEMRGMFMDASSFNRMLSSWDVSNVWVMSYMFKGTSYALNLSSWNVSNVTDCTGFSEGNTVWVSSNKPSFTNCGTIGGTGG